MKVMKYHLTNFCNHDIELNNLHYPATARMLQVSGQTNPQLLHRVAISIRTWISVCRQAAETEDLMEQIWSQQSASAFVFSSNPEPP